MVCAAWYVSVYRELGAGLLGAGLLGAGLLGAGLLGAGLLGAGLLGAGLLGAGLHAARAEAAGAQASAQAGGGARQRDIATCSSESMMPMSAAGGSGVAPSAADAASSVSVVCLLSTGWDTPRRRTRAWTTAPECAGCSSGSALLAKLSSSSVGCTSLGRAAASLVSMNLAAAEESEAPRSRSTSMHACWPRCRTLGLAWCVNSRSQRKSLSASAVGCTPSGCAPSRHCTQPSAGFSTCARPTAVRSTAEAQLALGAAEGTSWC
jgi:hypothetical protein